MKINHNFQLAPVIAVAVTSLIGFIVAHKVAPNIAWGRLFIDLGVLLSIIFLGFTARKRPSIDADQVEKAMKELAAGRYDIRLSPASKSDCGNLINTFNDLAAALSDQSVVSTEQKISDVVPALRWQSAGLPTDGHSHHPELGPVKTLGLMRETLSQYSSSTLAAKPDRDVGPIAKISELHEIATQESAVADQNSSILIEDLFSQYARARKENNLNEITFEVFKKTIDETRKVLLTQHECKAVKFDVVSEKGEVALRPRLVR